MSASPIRVGAITFDWYPFDPLVRRMAEAAIDGGCAVDVVCLRQQHEPSYEEYGGVHVYRLPMNRGFGRSLPVTIMSWCWFMLLAGITITHLHLKHRYDVVHVHNLPDFLVFSALFPKLLGAKVVLHVQDVSPELMAAKANGRKRTIILRLAIWQERVSTAFADHVITVGWPFEQLLLQRGLAKEKITIILNSADPRLFPQSRQSPLPCDSNASGPDSPFIIMYHGTLAERNGLETAIQALALARRVIPQVRLDIQGRGEYIPVLKELAATLDVSNAVTFRESCPSEKIVDFVVHGDVGIIPYRNDGFMELVLPTKTYEFAWMHRPMIASDTPAIRSMFRQESLVLCDSTNPQDFADAIIKLYQQPELRQRMIANAAEDYTSYQWEVMAQRYQQLLAALSGRSTSRSAEVQFTSEVTSSVGVGSNSNV
ncbi:MAG: glycosyltransferase family 4 protein [Ktedonobacteraceae bacterium]